MHSNPEQAPSFQTSDLIDQLTSDAANYQRSSPSFFSESRLSKKRKNLKRASKILLALTAISSIIAIAGVLKDDDKLLLGGGIPMMVLGSIAYCLACCYAHAHIPSTSTNTDSNTLTSTTSINEETPTANNNNLKS